MAKTRRELPPEEFAKYYMGGFDPAAPEGDKTVVLQRYQEELLAKVIQTAGLPLSLMTPRKPASGTVHTWSPLATGAPIPMPPPPPYGTALRPTTGNRNHPHWHRMMVIGPLPSNPKTATLMISVRPDNQQGFAITNDTLWTEWEVPD